MIRTATLALALLASGAAAQTPRLVIRAAVVPDHAPVLFDTTFADAGDLDETSAADTTDGSGDARTTAPAVLTLRAPADTRGMERAALPDGSTVFLGQALQALGPGSVTDAHLAFDPFTTAPEISLTMSAEAGQAFACITEAQAGQALAVVLDGRVLTAPTVNGPIPNGRVQITGQFTVAEAEAIVSAIREATQAGDARAAQLRDLRASVDLSRPDSAALAMRRAALASDWPTLAHTLHPDVLRALREDAADRLTLRDGKVLASDQTLPAPRAGGARPDTLLWLSVRDVLGAEPPGDRLDDFSDEQIAALLFAAHSGPRPSFPAAQVVGVVREAAGVAYVVLVPAEPTPFGDAGISEATVVEVRLAGTEWRVLLPSGAW